MYLGIYNLSDCSTVAWPTLMTPLVPTMTASLGSFKADEKVSTAILFLENFRVTTTVSSAPVVAKAAFYSSTQQIHDVKEESCFVTCLITVAHGLDALWLLSIKHHAHELQAVDAQIQGCSSTQGLIYWSPHIDHWDTKVCPHHFYLTYFPLGD